MERPLRSSFPSCRQVMGGTSKLETTDIDDKEELEVMVVVARGPLLPNGLEALALGMLAPSK
eukprot:5812902-Alexandrium_andersonii.AAC.1